MSSNGRKQKTQRKTILQIGIDTSSKLSQNLQLSAFNSIKDIKTQSIRQKKASNQKEILEDSYISSLKQLENLKQQENILKKYQKRSEKKKIIKKKSFSSDCIYKSHKRWNFNEIKTYHEIRRRSSSFQNYLGNHKLQKLTAMVPNQQTKYMIQHQFRQQLLMQKSVSFYKKKSLNNRQSFQINQSQKNMLSQIVNKFPKQSVCLKKQENPSQNSQSIIEVYSQKQLKSFFEQDLNGYKIRMGSKDDIYLNQQMKQINEKEMKQKKKKESDSKLKGFPKPQFLAFSKSFSEQSESEDQRSYHDQKENQNKQNQSPKEKGIIFQNFLQKNRLLTNKTLKKFINTSCSSKFDDNQKCTSWQGQSISKRQKNEDFLVRKSSLVQIYKSNSPSKIFIQPRPNYQLGMSHRQKVSSFHSKIEEVYIRNSVKSPKYFSPVYTRDKVNFQ